MKSERQQPSGSTRSRPFKKPWTDEDRKRYRHPYRDGYSSHRLMPLIKELRGKGKTLPMISAMTGIPLAVIRRASSRLSSPYPEEELTTLTDLALELGVAPNTVKSRAERLDIDPTKYGRLVAYREKDVVRLLEAFSYLNPPAQEEWGRLSDLCDLFGVTPQQMYRRLKRPPWNTIRRDLIGGNKHNAHRFNLHDARLVKSQLPVALTSPPAGSYTVPHMARMLGMNEMTLYRYIREGCPHTPVLLKGSKPTVYVTLSQVAGWLMQSPEGRHQRAHRLITTILLPLQQKSA